MLNKKSPFLGFTIVEILICLLLGSLLLTMVIGIYITNISTGNKAIKASRLRTDLQALMGIMENDIRRAGYGGDQFMVGAGKIKVVDSIDTKTEQCLVYSYNYDHTTTATASHFMGFRYSTKNKSVQFGRKVDPQASQCFSNGYWVNLTDPDFLKITQLHFVEHTVSNTEFTSRSVEIALAGELASDSQYSYQLTAQVRIRNPETH